MEPQDIQAKEASSLYTLGDRSSSDIIVRLRNEEGLENWVYCHSKILTEQSKYFADRLSHKSSPCKIYGSRNSLDLYCPESKFDHYRSLLTLLYRVSDPFPEVNLFQSVTSALGILYVAKKLSCSKIITACLEFLEAVPWNKQEEEEILKIIPKIRSEAAAPVLARLQAVDESSVIEIFLLAFRFVTSSPLLHMISDIKTSIQKQIDNMITADENAPLVIVDENIKLQVKYCVKKTLFVRLFQCLEEAVTSKPVDTKVISKYKMVLSDLLWAFEIVKKMQVFRDFVITWVDTSEKLVNVVESMGTVAETFEIRLKVIEVSAKVLESVGDGTVILPTVKRLQMVKLWLSFVRNMKKPLVEDEIDGKVWKTLQVSFNEIIQTLPSSDQTQILTEWCIKKEMYPDLKETFDFWCKRSKEAKRKLTVKESKYVWIRLR